MMDVKRLKKLKETYLKAKALCETMKEIELKIKTEVLKENEFYYGQQWEEGRNGRSGKAGRVTDARQDYMMDDEQFKTFLHLCHIKWLEYDKNHQENESLWKYEKMVRDSEDLMFEWMKVELPKAKPEMTVDAIEKMRLHWNYRKKALDLTLKLATI